MRQGSRLGRIVRGAFATRGASGNGKGSGAPKLALATFAALLASLVLGVSLALAASAPLVTIEAPSAINPAAGHYYFSGHVNPNGTEAENETSWEFTCSPSCGTLTGPNLAPGESPQLVEVDVENLQANTAYTVTLSATNGGGTVEASRNFKTSTAVPGLTVPSSVPLTAGGVDIGGYLNPRNLPVTNCHFSYGLTEGYGQTVPCRESAEEIGSGHAAVAIGASLSGLVPGATYHMRAAASNSAGTTETEDATFLVPAPEAEGGCANEALRSEQHSTYLSDCRAYEMVSPPRKNGGDIGASSSRTHAAADGSAIDYISLAGFGDVHGSSIVSDYIAQRSTDPSPGTSGWATHGITPQQDPTNFQSIFDVLEPHYIEFSSDLSQGLYQSLGALSPEPNVEEAASLYLREDPLAAGPGSYSLASPCPLCAESEPNVPLPPLPGKAGAAKETRPGFAAAAEDLSHFIFESHFQLTPGAPGENCSAAGSFPPIANEEECATKLYESDHGALRLAGLVPPEPATECEEGGAPECVIAERSIAGRGARLEFRTPHTFSAAGSRILFTVPSSPEGNSGKLYERIDNGAPNAQTLQVNASELASPEEPQPATYEDASADGQRVFFVSSENLTDDAQGTGTGGKLYMFEADKPAGHRLTYVSKPQPGAPDVGQDMPTSNTGVVGASDDGHYVYFIALGQLVAGQLSLGSNGAIYLWHDGTLGYVGELASVSFDAGELISSGPWRVRARQSRVTPNGRHLLFTSSSGEGLLSAHGAADTKFAAGCGGECKALYLYDADTNSLRCVSCDPAGEVTQPASNFIHQLSSASLETGHFSRALSDNGRYVFFDTAQPLVPEDTNDKVDAYEFDALSGEPHLLSSGTSPVDSYFLEASADGRDVFLDTNQRLSGWDTDGSYDLYDARAGGGFPEPPPIVAACEGEACKGSSPSPSAPQSAASATLAGPGNPRRSRCRKGTRAVKRHGKTQCVKKHRRHHHKRANANRRTSR
jgi:hypothetical protein